MVYDILYIYRLFKAHVDVPAVKLKADWALRWLNNKVSPHNYDPFFIASLTNLTYYIYIHYIYYYIRDV